MATILIIEDNLEIRENITEILELEDHTVITAENGKIGILMARERLPDLIFCDLMMPLVNGYEVITELKRDGSTSGIPFIFLTASTEKQNIQTGLSLGAVEYILKPFTTEDLLKAITNVFSKRVDDN